MFHIIFTPDKNYIKYAATLMTSIIHSTDKNKKFKDFFAENLPCMSCADISATYTGGGSIA